MLLARFAPVGSPRYEKLANSSEKFDKMIEWLSPQLFAIWTIFVAGISAGKAQLDRHYFWDWSDWLIGMIGLLLITLIYYPLKKKLKIKELDEINWRKNSKDSLIYILTVIFLFCIGWLLVSQFNFRSLYYSMLLYIVFLGAVSIVYLVKVEDNLVYDVRAKNINILIGIMGLLFAIIAGCIEDDPIISTSSLVSIPFFVVLLFGKHVRHLERVKFYPIFIFAMFVSSREAWFLIPLFILFFVLRSYNYLRYQKVVPTFGVSSN